MYRNVGVWSISMVLTLGAGCVDSYQTELEKVEITQDSDRGNDWMIGTWNCDVQYFNAAPWIDHKTTATYTLSQGANGAVHGAYREALFGPQPAVNIDDTWILGTVPVYSNGTVELLYTASSSDGTRVTASGTLRGAVEGDDVILGFDDLSGAVTLADGTRRDWTGGEIAILHPTEFLRNWNVGIGAGTFQLYHDADCFLIP